MTEDGQTVDVANIIWCTGYRPGFSWIDLPIIGDRQEPQHERGVLPQEPGLYFVGLEFSTPRRPPPSPASGATHAAW